MRKECKKSRLHLMSQNYQIYFMLLPCLVYFIIFAYVPMYGVQIAFKDYNTGLGIWNSPWVGLKHFKNFLSMKQFYNVLLSLKKSKPEAYIIDLIFDTIPKKDISRVHW